MPRERGARRRLRLFQKYVDSLPEELRLWWASYIECGMYHQGYPVAVTDLPDEEADADMAVRELLEGGDAGL